MSNLSYSSAFNPTIASSSSSDDTDDACSICLEPFTLQDPSTVTSCKHEYHLQCIIEWSQRSKECPICWQMFVLKDPASQELLSAVDKERLLKTSDIRLSSSSSSRTIDYSNEDFHFEEEESSFSSFDEQFLRHLAEAAHRRCLLRTRDSIVLASDPATVQLTDMGSLDQVSAIVSHGERENTNPCLSPGSMTPSPPATAHASAPRDSTNGSRISPGISPRRSSPTHTSPESASLPEAIKSKLAAASARYKESISKSKQGFKEKLLARNNSVKELSKGVQREMNAGIAGVTRMIERLDLASKRFGGSAQVSTSTNNTASSGFNFSFKGKRVEANSKSSNNGDITRT